MKDSHQGKLDDSERQELEEQINMKKLLLTLKIFIDNIRSTIKSFERQNLKNDK